MSGFFDDCWTAFAGADASSLIFLFFISFFLMIAVRVSPYAACFTNGEPWIELTAVYFRRAWGMTAKDVALPDSPYRWRDPCASSPEINRPVTAGITPLKTMAEQQAACGEPGRRLS